MSPTISEISSRNILNSKIRIDNATQKAKNFQQKLHQRHSRSEKAWRTLMTTGKASREENGISVHATIASTKPTSEEVAQFFEMEIPESREGFVYFVRIRDTLNVKIGYSKDRYLKCMT